MNLFFNNFIIRQLIVAILDQVLFFFNDDDDLLNLPTYDDFVKDDALIDFLIIEF